jgi:hypothetical protein
MAPTELIPITAMAVAGIAMLINFVGIILDLRAKARARDVLSRKAVDDPELKELINQISSGVIASETASKAISNALAGELHESDLRRVEEGLHQVNKSGERQYINMLLF